MIIVRFYDAVMIHLQTAMAMLLSAISTGLAAAPYAYITNQGSNNVSVIDLESRQVIQTLDVGEKPAGIAVSQAARAA